MTEYLPKYVAVEEMLWLKPDGLAVSVTARVGAPFRAVEGGWECQAEIEGFEGPYNIKGETSMQALCLATELVAKRLEHLLEDGAHLVYIDDSTSRWDIDSLRSVFGIRP